MKCTCGKEIPEKRVSLGYRECVDCSTVEKYGCVDLVYHKTGNTIEILPAPEAKKMQELSKRRGFGSMTSMHGSRAGSSVAANLPSTFTEEDFRKAGEEVMKEYEVLGVQAALDLIGEMYRKEKISSSQKKRLDNIFVALNSPAPSPVQRIYWRPEASEPRPEVDPEIQEAMRQWKWWR
jgi:hypothetical protein